MGILDDLRARFGGDEPEPSLPPPDPHDEVEQLSNQLTVFIRRVNASAGKLPEGAVPQVRRIEDVLRGVLRHALQNRSGALGAHETAFIDATVNDYLPTSIDRYLALPPDFVATHRNINGLSAGEDLVEQLMLLEHGVREVAQAVYAGDAEQLTTQGRFLQAKFSRSDLDLS